MQSKQPNAKVSLRGAIVRCDDGTSVVVPWTDVELCGLSMFSARARTLYPNLPTTLVFGPEVGSDIRTRLRIRAFARAFRQRSVDEYFQHGEQTDLVRFGITIAISSAILAVAFEWGLRTVASSSMPGVTVQFDANLLAVITFIRCVFVACVALLPSLLIIRGVLGNRFPRLLAVRFTSDGATLRREDGVSEYRTWKTILDNEKCDGGSVMRLERIWSPSQPWERAFLGYRAKVIRRAAKRAFGRPEGRIPAEVRLRSALRKLLPIGLVGVAFWVMVTTLAILFPDKARPGGPPPSPEFDSACCGFCVLLCSVLAILLMIQYFGWHRANLRWRQMWQLRESLARSGWDLG